MVGQRIAHYTVVRQVGSGGMGSVYEATDERTRMRVAIKVLRPEFAQNREALTRFVNEMRATNLVDHPGLVKIFESGNLPDGTAYLVMEFLDGETLSSRLRHYRGPMPELEARRILWQLASSLAEAHKKSIIHRDLKPGNIMLVPDPANPGVDRVKLLDFGIAKLDVRSLNLEDPQTRTGILMGTPHYMSPEQCRGAAQVDDRADVYSLGVILFQMLTGRLPFIPPEDGEGMVMAMHIYEQPPPPRSLVPSLSEPMERLVLDMLKKERGERPTMVTVCQRIVDSGGPMGLTNDLSVTFEDDISPTTKRPQVKLPSNAGAPTLVGASVPRLPEMATMIGAQSLTSMPSTLGTSTGQMAASTPVPQRSRRNVILGAAGALGLVIVVGAALLWPGQKPTRPPVTGPKNPGEPAGPEAKGATAKPPEAVRHCELRSDPLGAQVVRESDHTVLGETPWKYEQPLDTPPLVLLLRRSGYGERALALDCQAGPTRTEKLEPLPPPAPTTSRPAGPGKGKGKGKGKNLGSKKPVKKGKNKAGKSKPGPVKKITVIE